MSEKRHIKWSSKDWYPSVFPAATASPCTCDNGWVPDPKDPTKKIKHEDCLGTGKVWKKTGG